MPNVVGWLEACGATLEAPDPKEPEEPDEPEPVPPPMPLTALQVPVNDPELSAALGLFETSASGPGFGNCTSLLSTVVHPFPRLATKRSGRLENGTAGALRVLDPELTVTDEQDI